VKAASKIHRRWLGAICLLTAIAMLIVGETLLKNRLQPLAFATYWSVCFILTAIAACVAVVDASRVRAEQRDAQRDLIESTIQEIEREKRLRKGTKG